MVWEPRGCQEKQSLESKVGSQCSVDFSSGSIQNHSSGSSRAERVLLLIPRAGSLWITEQQLLGALLGLGGVFPAMWCITLQLWHPGSANLC